MNSAVAIFMSDIFFNDTATTEIYTLSLHDALPILHYVYSNNISCHGLNIRTRNIRNGDGIDPDSSTDSYIFNRSEEHTSELQSRQYLVCRLLLEKKKNHTMQYSMKLHKPHSCTSLL